MLLDKYESALARLARVDQGLGVQYQMQVIASGATFGLNIGDAVDLEAERARLAKAIVGAKKERDGLLGRLNNASFIEKAKPEAVEKARSDLADKAAEAERLSAALARLG